MHEAVHCSSALCLSYFISIKYEKLYVIIISIKNFSRPTSFLQKSSGKGSQREEYFE